MGVFYKYYIFNIFKKYCFDGEPDPDPTQNLDPDPDPDPDPGGVGKPKMCIPPGKILGTPLLPTPPIFPLNSATYLIFR